MMRQEWHRLFKNKILLIVTVAVIAIPTIYTTLFLGSMWDPYGNIDKLPVAVINHDVPVTYEDQKLDIGGTLMEELKKNDSLDFQFPSETEARKGLEDGTYYMVITIPEDFSAHASTLTDAHPEKMTLAYETNPGTNYIASKMSETAMKELESSVREEVTKTYTEVLFGKLAELGDGMQEAADGSGELKTGTDQLADGNQMITDNLQALSDSALVFVDGSRELEVGIGRYTDGASAVAAGAEELQRGANALDSGVNGAQKGGSDLAAGAVDVDDNMTMLNAGLSELNAEASALPDAADALNDGAASLGDSAQQLSDGIASLSEGAAGLKTGADALSSGLQSAASSSQSLRDGAAGISQALSALAGEEGVPEEVRAQIAAVQQLLIVACREPAAVHRPRLCQNGVGRLGVAHVTAPRPTPGSGWCRPRRLCFSAAAGPAGPGSAVCALPGRPARLRRGSSRPGRTRPHHGACLPWPALPSALP